jgi:hypothetical protein
VRPGLGATPCDPPLSDDEGGETVLIGLTEVEVDELCGEELRSLRLLPLCQVRRTDSVFFLGALNLHQGIEAGQS